MQTICQGERGRDAMKILKGLGFSEDIGRNTQSVMMGVVAFGASCVTETNICEYQ